MNSGPIEHLQEKVVAGSLLTSGAGKAAAVIDSFVSWLLAGFGAALALLIGNIAEVIKYVRLETIKNASVLFLVSTALTIVEKYLASRVIGAAESASIAAEVGRRLADEDIEIDFSVVFGELRKATLPPMRWLVARGLDKVEKGDFAASGRSFARQAQFQALLSLIVAGLVLWAMGLIVAGLGG